MTWSPPDLAQPETPATWLPPDPLGKPPDLDGRARADPGDPVIDTPPTARTPDMRADDPWAEAGRKILRFHLARMLARLPGVIAGEDPEEVHAMRVATRRMLAAWRVFGDGFEREARRRHRRDLREIAARLGAVRDLDVLLEILAAEVAQRGDRGRAGLAPLARLWVAERGARRAELMAFLGSDAFSRTVAECEELVEEPGRSALPAVRHAPWLVRTRLPAQAWGAYQAAWAFDDGLGGSDLATLHELRIAGKWLRYTLEFAREALEPEATALIRPVVALQDHLGAQHDLHVAATRAREDVTRSGSLSSRETRSIERFVRHLDQGVEHFGRSYRPAWRSIVSPAYRRRLGRALARL